jgi:hypothetical protein
VQYDDAQILYLGLLKFALLLSQIQLVLVHVIKDKSCYALMFIQRASEDQDVVEIDRDDSLCD